MNRSGGNQHTHLKGKLTEADYRVEKMKFAKKKDYETGKNINDRLELFQRVVTVSLETQKIVNALPTLEIREDG